MKRVAGYLALLVMLLTACGLKVPATIVAGSETELGGPAPVDAEGNPIVDPTTALPTGEGPGDVAAPEVDGSVTTPTGPATSIFNSETEGVTNDRITLCSHVPITGAAPIPHHENRFGQFYFDYVNQELGGVYGRQVQFKVFDDRYFPAGARDAMEQCRRLGSFIYLGAAGTDQIVSVAKWAERVKVPYLHGPTSIRDMAGLNYNVGVGPAYEYQHELLARYLVKEYGKDVNYGTVRVDSPYFEAGTEAFIAELKRLGANHVVELKVQKDERQFQNVFFELQSEEVQVVNNFTTPNIWINMMAQKPSVYNPTFTAVSPVAGFNIVARALPPGIKAVVFHSFQPACECTFYTDSGASGTVTPPKSLPYYDDIQEFLRVFKKYSPEQDPPPDDFDFSSFLAARGLHRLLLKLGPQPTRTKLWGLFDSYKETLKQSYPGCPGDFTRGGSRIGAWYVNVLELQTRGTDNTWRQAETCIDRV